MARTLVQAEHQDAMGAQIEALVKAGRVVEFFPQVPAKRKNRVRCRIIVADKRGWDGWGGTDESEGRGLDAAEALREAMEDVEV